MNNKIEILLSKIHFTGSCSLLVINTLDVLNNLKGHEVELCEGTVEDYIDSFTDCHTEHRQGDTKQWHSPLTHHFKFDAYSFYGKCFVSLACENGMGNYTNNFLFQFGSFDDFLFCLLQSNKDFSFPLEIDGELRDFVVDVDILSDFVRLSENGNHLTEIVAEDLADLEEKIIKYANKE